MSPERPTSGETAAVGGEPMDPAEPGLLLGYANVLLRHRRLVLLLALVPFVFVVIARSFVTPLWTSRASFMPQATDQLSNLAGLAAQFGVGVPAKGDDDSPAFYGDLLRTREVLTTVLQAPYEVVGGDSVGHATLLQLLDIDGANPGLRMEKAVKRLSERLQVTVNARTGVVTFAVSMPAPGLARQVANRLLQEVNRFNLERRKTRASAELEFNAHRLEELQGELRAAEDRLESFLQRNRDFRNSPQLTFQQERLARDVEFRQSVYTTVSQAYERARMDQVRDTPVITVVEAPSLPARSDGRGRVIYGLLALMAGGLAGFGLALLRDYRARQAVAPDPEYADFVTLLAETRRDVRRLFHLPGRGAKPGRHES